MPTTQQRPRPQSRSDSQGRGPYAVEASGLTKTFGTTRAVDRIDLSVPAGSICGLLGPNGAGKTTTIRMLATLLRPDAGSARVLGHDVVREADAVRSRVSLTGQYASVDQDLSGIENLTLVARLLGLGRAAARSRARELLDAFGLGAAAKRPVKTYSGGMRRRLDIATSIIVTPELIFLDEPTTGLDPRSRNQVWEILRDLVAQEYDRTPHDAVPRRSRSAGRPDHRHRRRPGGRRGDQWGAESHGRCRSLARATTRPGTTLDG